MSLEIIPYPELKDRTDLYHLWAQSFSFLATPRWLEGWIKIEDWLQDTPIGFCGLLDGRLVGFVGVMEIPTRDRHGQVEIVGGVWAVATRPSCRRQGVGRRILEVAEAHFRERGLRFSFLTTSRAIVAHRWYQSVGYEDVTIVDGYSHLYKILMSRPVAPAGRPSAKAQRLDHRQIVANFARQWRNHCGFVYRTDRRLQVLERMGAYDPANSQVTPQGHLLASRQFGSSRVIEVLAGNKKTYGELIRSLERRTAAGVYLPFVSDPMAIEVLAKANYRRDQGSFDVLMAKPLAGANFDDVYDESFVISRCEFF